MTEPIRVDVWSDVACPWCYIGKRHFEAALAEVARDPEPVDVEVEYRSFQLAPDMPEDFAGSEVDHLVQHKGIDERQARAMIEQVTAAARRAGLDYDFDALRPANTGKAHELLQYAKAHGRQSDVKERLLRAHFVEGATWGSSTSSSPSRPRPGSTATTSARRWSRASTAAGSTSTSAWRGTTASAACPSS